MWKGMVCLVCAVVLFASPTDAQVRVMDGWEVNVDEMLELDQFLNREYRERGFPGLVDGVAFEIRRTDGDTRSDQSRQELVDGWQRNLVDTLTKRGFDAIDPDLLEKQTGITMAELRRQFERAIPFGQRDTASAQLAANFYILTNEEACSRADGVLAAYVMGIYPPSEVLSDYGSVSVMLVGLGGCGPENAATASRLRTPQTND